MDTVTLTIQRAKEVSGLGRTTLYKQISDGKLDVVKVGRRTLIKVDSLRRLLEAA
jgi:excisionase family DNA binding protein